MSSLGKGISSSPEPVRWNGLPTECNQRSTVNPRKSSRTGSGGADVAVVMLAWAAVYTTEENEITDISKLERKLSTRESSLEK